MSHRTGRSNLVSRLVAALGALTLLATACGSGDPGTTESSTTLVPTDTTPGATTDATTPAEPGATAPTAVPGDSGPTPTPAGGAGGGPAVTAGPVVAPPGSLAGLWAGEYTSVVPANANGTFTVVFEGAAPDYTGSIVIAGLCEPDCPITAKVTGNAIGFGSVESRAVTYKGTISGSSMSGTYTVGTDGQGEGTWKAVKG